MKENKAGRKKEKKRTRSEQERIAREGSELSLGVASIRKGCVEKEKREKLDWRRIFQERSRTSTKSCWSMAERLIEAEPKRFSGTWRGQSDPPDEQNSKYSAKEERASRKGCLGFISLFRTKGSAQGLVDSVPLTKDERKKEREREEQPHEVDADGQRFDLSVDAELHSGSTEHLELGEVRGERGGIAKRKFTVRGGLSSQTRVSAESPSLQRSSFAFRSLRNRISSKPKAGMSTMLRECGTCVKIM